MHICRWIDKGQTWDIYFVRLDGPRLFTTCRFLYFAVAAWGDEVRAEMGTVSPAEIRFVRKDSDTASSQKKWAVHVISVQMVVKIRNTKLSIAFSVKEVSVRYFSGRQVVGSQPFVKALALTGDPVTPVLLSRSGPRSPHSLSRSLDLPCGKQASWREACSS